jgi:hypothetical protein
MGLEEVIYASVDIRNFLKLFSEQQWNKVCKATLLLGIHRLKELSERCGSPGLTHITVGAIEELVIAAHKKAKNKKRGSDKPAESNKMSKARKHREKQINYSETKQTESINIA